jgi:hypothetical protein
VTAPPAAAERPPISCAACGCGGAIALALAAMVAFTWLNYRAAEGFRRHAADPAARGADFARILPARALPPGYHALGGLRVPGMLAMAAAVDREPGPVAPGEPGVRAAFLFVRTRDWFGRREKVAALFAADGPDPGAFEQNEVRFAPREDAGRGEVAAGGARVLYFARRGELTVDLRRFGAEVPEADPAERTFPGVATLMLFDCGPDERWLRVGLWFTPDPAPTTPAATADLRGTPADPAALAEFLDSFRLCG